MTRRIKKNRVDFSRGNIQLTDNNSSGFFLFSKLPTLVQIILASTVLAVLPGSFLGFRFSGWGWLIPLFFSIYTLMRKGRKITFPVMIWFPWVLFLLVQLFLTDFQSLQRTAQLITPLVIGAAISTVSLSDWVLAGLSRVFRIYTLLIAFLMVAKTGMLLTGVIPKTTGLAAEVMITVLFAVYFAASYSVRRQLIDLYQWCIMAVMPVFALTRTAIAVAGLTLPLTLGPIRPLYRIVIIVTGLSVATALFYTDRFQSKMFSYTGGQGEISDVLEGNVADHSRFYMWRMFGVAIEQKPFLGYGAGEGEKFARSISKGRLQYPHNDYLLTRYDFGWIGLLLFLTTCVYMFWHAFRRSWRKHGEVKILYLTGAGAFIPFWMLMGSDNIMIYASYWGNLHFMMLGLAYSTMRKVPSIKHYENPSRP